MRTCLDRFAWVRLGVCWLFAAFVFANVGNAADPLPRRGFLGVQIQATSDQTRNQLGIATQRGVEVLMVVPNSTAESAKVKKGDVILSLAGKSVYNVAGFMDLVGSIREGKEVEIVVNREGKEKILIANPTPLPLEKSADFTIEYGDVTSKAGRLRTVLTLPHSSGKKRAIVLLSGLGNGAAEHPIIDQLGLRSLSTAFTRKGFAVLRVDKPGCGDSEGGPARDADFESVVDGYVAGVRQLKADARIDGSQIYLCAVSIGGLQAPLVAQKESVAGIALFGTAGLDWLAYLEENGRRQLANSGLDAARIEEEIKAGTAGWKGLIHDQLTPDEVANRNPELGGWVEQTWVDGQYFQGITYRFFQQLGRAQIEDAWRGYNGRVLTLWGEFDFVTSASDHEKIAAIVNAKNPGWGEYRKLSQIDHGLRIAKTLEEAIQNTQQSGAHESPAFTTAVIDWLTSLEKNAKSDSGGK